MVLTWLFVVIGLGGISSWSTRFISIYVLGSVFGSPVLGHRAGCSQDQHDEAMHGHLWADLICEDTKRRALFILKKL